MKAFNLALAFGIALGAVSARAQSLTFAGTPAGELPRELEAALTGGGPPPRWEVVADPTADGGKALAQTSADPTDLRFPLALTRAPAPADVEVATRFKPVSGKEDQAGGLVVRVQDVDNYYVTRANALENNVRFYRVVKGRRQQLASANAKVTSGEWHSLTLRAEGNRFTVSFDGRQVITAADATFKAPGKVGLWTKADSVTRFESLSIKPLR
ncbi:MAG TPA: family 16 glycoside hydrolase [Beijerinckiaceae bacterium]|jgi:hypothetical protein